MAAVMQAPSQSPTFADWDYLDYDPTHAHRLLGRIVPDPDGTIAVVYRIETLDGERLQDGHLSWADISAQLQKLPPAALGVAVTDQAVIAAILAARLEDMSV